MVQIEGKYKRKTEEKYDEFLSKLGVNYFLRKAANASNPTMDISKNGNKWKFVTSTIAKNITLEFEIVS